MEFEYYLTQEQDDRLIKKSFEEKTQTRPITVIKSHSYLKEAAGPSEGNLSGQCLF